MIQKIETIKQFKLLYRASENNYSVADFHQKCDEKPNTLTIIRTEFDKVIGGFTPKKWGQSGSYLTDEEGKTFLFSLSLKQKMDCQVQDKSIYNHSSFGPTFGSGHDISIRNQCNNNRDSVTNFPTSYNFTDNKYKNNQYSYAVFSGQTDGNGYKVQDYEVYEVVY